MILPIYILGQPVLRKVAEDIPTDYPNLDDFLKDMWDTLAESEGIGLAAPQVGKSIRVVVIDLDVLSDDSISIRISWNMTKARRTHWKKAVCRFPLFTRR